MENRNFYNQILTEHNANPFHKGTLADSTVSLNGVNPSCGDEISLHLKIENDIIVDGSFEGFGCAISQAGTDIMLDMIIGQTKSDAITLFELFSKMIKGNITEEELEELEEASAFKDISHMPARVKCAMLGWNTLEKALNLKVD